MLFVKETSVVETKYFLPTHLEAPLPSYKEHNLMTAEKMFWIWQDLQDINTGLLDTMNGTEGCMLTTPLWTFPSLPRAFIGLELTSN